MALTLKKQVHNHEAGLTVAGLTATAGWADGIHDKNGVCLFLARGMIVTLLEWEDPATVT